MNIWCPHTIRPIIPIINNAISIGSLPDTEHWQYLGSISLINPNAGMIRIYTSGWPRDQKGCWRSKRSPPLNGSENDELECLS